ncbi:hypothetical protein TRICI_001369 [Trichomonascus ciferrii]|uniref:Mevalonate kinase n=1 Tax=Trichomonascus ciferrii TaxID=44093 RepID=A0A642VB19_9ASCO|nr:hypothetical protein TRICI_001369 [Trichomonascus ciferrii]
MTVEGKETSYVVSAPGKVILFGEHSVVYGQPAIAAAVSLRTYLLVTEPRVEGYVTLDLPDTGMSKSWRISELPFVADGDVAREAGRLDHGLVERLEPLLSDLENTYQHSASLAFLYLYCSMCTAHTPAHTYGARSVLPIGAGLGSSASYTVCVAGALLKAAGLAGRADAADLINSWSFMGETCVHGNPSGIDNAVATRGGAVYFQREPKVAASFAFPPLKLILTNTAIPRRTSDLVAGVGKLKDRLPAISQPLLDAMGEVAKEAYEILKTDNDDVGQRLGELARINHGLLVALGVSHPVLEQVKCAADAVALGHTKLTGAGGGGCAITIVDDESKLTDELLASFSKAVPEPCEVFETVLGAQGVGYTVLDRQLDMPEFLKLSGSKEYDALGEWHYWK